MSLQYFHINKEIRRYGFSALFYNSGNCSLAEGANAKFESAYHQDRNHLSSSSSALIQV